MLPSISRITLDYLSIYFSVCLSIFNNVLDQKIVFNAHFFSTNILYSLQKLHQYNKKSQEHQTKINTAINTN